MPRWVKSGVAILLLPACVGSIRTLIRLFAQTGRAETIWVALLGGAACWWTVFLLLPKPMRIYVFGHELTHALWTWLFLGRVKKFKVTAKGGHVVITRNNFLITLAPYFFPLYAVLVVVVFVSGHLLWGLKPYFVWFHFLLGAAYGFHVTFTWHILQSQQSDITSQGYLFSAVVVFLGNMLLLLLGVPLLTAKIPIITAFEWWWQDTLSFLMACARFLRGPQT